MEEPEMLGFSDFNDYQLQRFANTMMDWAGQIVYTVNMLQLGIDLHALFFFDKNVPKRKRTRNGTVQFVWGKDFTEEYIKEHSYIVCRDFLIDFSLRIDALLGT